MTTSKSKIKADDLTVAELLRMLRAREEKICGPGDGTALKLYGDGSGSFIDESVDVEGIVEFHDFENLGELLRRLADHSPLISRKHRKTRR